MKKISINLLVTIAIFIFFTSIDSIYSQQNIDFEKINSDTINIKSKKTKKYITLQAVNYLIHILPPDNTFKIINNGRDFGISSKKYNASILLKFQSVNKFSYIDSTFNKTLNYYKDIIRSYNFFKSDNILFKYMQYGALVGNDTMSTWNMICGNDIFALNIYVTYPIREENKLGKLMKKTLTSLIFEPNPAITPEYNTPFTCDYSLLGLKFFQRTGLASIFTEDGLPLELTKGSKCFFSVVIPPSTSQTDNLADNVITLLNNTFFEPYLQDNILASKVLETEIQQQKGIEIEGSFKNNYEKVFLVFMAATASNYNIIVGYCNEDEKDLFFEKIRKLKQTWKISY